MPQRSGSRGTLDAPGYQVEIARPLIPAAAEWRLAVKKNFRALHRALEACFGQPFEGDLLHARVSRTKSPSCCQASMNGGFMMLA